MCILYIVFKMGFKTGNKYGINSKNNRILTEEEHRKIQYLINKHCGYCRIRRKLGISRSILNRNGYYTKNKKWIRKAHW